MQIRDAPAGDGERKEWALSELDHQGSVYLVDPADGGVYAPPSCAQGVPILVGRRDATSGAVRLESATSAFAAALDRCLRDNQARLTRAFEVRAPRREGCWVLVHSRGSNTGAPA